MVPSVSSFIIEIWMRMILMMILMMIMMIMMMIQMTKQYDYDDNTDDDNDRKNDSYSADGAAPGASVPCSLFFVPGPLVQALWSMPFGPGPLDLAWATQFRTYLEPPHDRGLPPF